MEFGSNVIYSTESTEWICARDTSNVNVGLLHLSQPFCRSRQTEWFQVFCIVGKRRLSPWLVQMSWAKIQTQKASIPLNLQRNMCYYESQDLAGQKWEVQVILGHVVVGRIHSPSERVVICWVSMQLSGTDERRCLISWNWCRLLNDCPGTLLSDATDLKDLVLKSKLWESVFVSLKLMPLRWISSVFWNSADRHCLSSYLNFSFPRGYVKSQNFPD